MGHSTSLRGRGGLDRVTVAYAFFGFVENAVWMAVVLWAFERGGAGLTAVVSIAQLVPAALLSPAFAAYGDRGHRGTALVAAHGAVAVTAALTALALLAGAGPVVVVTASALLTTAGALVRPAHFAALPGLATDPRRLVVANARCSGIEQVATFLGPAAAGVGTAVAGAGWVLALCAALSAAAAVLCLRLGVVATGRPADGEAAPSAFREATQGLRVLRRDVAALALLLVLTGDVILAGALDVIGTAFAVDTLGLGQTGAGLVVGATGLGGLLGAVAAARLAQRRSLAPVVVAGCAVEGAAFAVAGTGGLAAATLALLVSGAGGGLTLVAGRTLLQRATDGSVLARVFAVQESVSLLGFAVGAAVAPALVGAVGPDGAFAPLGLAVVAGGLGTLVLVRRLDARAVVHPEEIALLRAVPFLSLLPPYELERLAQSVRTLDVAAGERVVRQGDPGTEYFVVADGELTVEVDGAATGSVLRRGTGFGEIALLHAVPRTATVIAAAPSRLLAVRAEDFLAAVTGSPDGRRVADDVAAAHLARDAQRVGQTG
jgi:MFS family permease